MTAPSRYPLQWPEGWKRTQHPKIGPFFVTTEKALKDLDAEIKRFGGKYALLSSNVELTMDGRMRFDRQPGDPGVAVYFELDGKQRVFACDSYRAVKDNIRAISNTIEALRAIKRYGASGLLDRTLSAFEALPLGKHWEVLGIKPTKNKEIIAEAWRSLVKEHHPDRGGTVARMQEINGAYEDALKSCDS
jgi:hypothetical protein